MEYLYFKILRFKGVREVRLDLRPLPASNVFTLVGLNESGKTTILEAISFFKYGAQEFEKLFEQTDRDPHAMIPVSERANFNGEVTIEAGIQLDDGDITELRAYMMSRFGLRKMKVSKTFLVQQTYYFKDSRFEKRMGLWSLEVSGRTGDQRKDRHFTSPSEEQWTAAVNFLKDRMTPIRYFPNFLFEFPDRIYLEPEESDARGVFYRDVLEGVLQALGLGATVEDHLLSRARSDDRRDRDNLDSLLLEMGRHVTQKVFDAWSQIFRREVRDKEVVIDYDSDDAGRYYVRFRIRDRDGYFAIGDRSLGFRWFFVYLLLTSYASGGRRGPVLFMFDEPASNLHPSAQRQLLESFSPLAARNIILYTTHSHYLINPAWLESTYVVRNAGVEPQDRLEDVNASRTDIRLERYRTFAARHPDQSHYFQPVLDVLDFRPSLLVDVPSVVMVEGKNDFYTLSWMRSNLGFEEPMNVLPGTGAGSLTAVIQLYLAWGRPFVVLLDSDSEGRRQSRRYQTAFGDIIEGRVVHLGDIDKRWSGMSMEALFDEVDRVAVTTAVGVDVDHIGKQVFNRAVQELLIQSRSVALTEATRARFCVLLEFLSERLRTL